MHAVSGRERRGRMAWGSPACDTHGVFSKWKSTFICIPLFTLRMARERGGCGLYISVTLPFYEVEREVSGAHQSTGKKSIVACPGRRSVKPASDRRAGRASDLHRAYPHEAECSTGGPHLYARTCTQRRPTPPGWSMNGEMGSYRLTDRLPDVSERRDLPNPEASVRET